MDTVLTGQLHNGHSSDWTTAQWTQFWNQKYKM